MWVTQTTLRAELDMFLDDALCFLLSHADISSMETFVCASVHVVVVVVAASAGAVSLSEIQLTSYYFIWSLSDTFTLLLNV